MAKKKNHNLSSRPSLSEPLFSNGIILLVFLIAMYLHNNSYDLYYLYVQEDGFLEWASFWAFLIAGGFFAFQTWKSYKTGGLKMSWFVAGLSVFCFIVAMEEISWGQRLLGYRPPTYFLANNYQQELNFHNVVDKEWRKIAMKMILLGYGVFLPLIGSIPKVGSFLRNKGIFSPPPMLIPAFAGTFLIYHTYPFRYTGEIVELMMGLGFLYASIGLITNLGKGKVSTKKELGMLLLSTGFVALFGIINNFTSNAFRNDDPKIINAATTEVQALFNGYVNMLSEKTIPNKPSCGFHRRLFTVQESSNSLPEAAINEFRSLQSQGLPEERAEFFIDPWNSPYWVRDYCIKDGRRVVQIYSFGPDRQRQSTKTTVGGDDIGLIKVFK